MINKGHFTEESRSFKHTLTQIDIKSIMSFKCSTTYFFMCYFVMYDRGRMCMIGYGRIRNEELENMVKGFMEAHA